jgi:hypothetical protein
MKPIEKARAEMAAKEEETAALFERAGKLLEVGVRLKKSMKNLGRTTAWAKCPFCPDGRLQCLLAGPRNHLSFACTRCDASLME